jgi:excinuclease ABC subunit A
VVAVGTPEEIAATRESYTGQYLKQVLDRRPSSKGASGKRPAATEAADNGLGHLVAFRLISNFACIIR